MIQWLCGRLPWEDKLQDPLYVRDAKIRWDPPSRARCFRLVFKPLGAIKSHRRFFPFRSQENISEFLTKCFSSQDKPGKKDGEQLTGITHEPLASPAATLSQNCSLISCRHF